MSCYICRVRQLCGDSANGAWNTNEMYPLTIMGGASMKKVNRILEKIAMKHLNT